MGPEDMVEVEVLGRTDFKVRSKIGADGSIQLPYVGSVPAANKTTLQLGDDVKAALDKGGYYKNPIMRVEVVATPHATSPCSAMSARPGWCPWTAPTGCPRSSPVSAASARTPQTTSAHP